MPSFRQGDVVRVPFPYTDRATRQMRPALVVSYGAIGDERRLLWVVMITSAGNRSWVGDVAIGDASQSAGPPVPSIVRPCKIATIEAAHAERVGRLPDDMIVRVHRALESFLGATPDQPSSKPG